MLACCAAPVILTIDYALVSVLAPEIRAELGLSDAELAWIFAAYSAGYGAFLLAAGRCADLYGTRRVLVAGLVLFAGAAVAVSTATTPATAIAARAVQGAAAAAMFAASLSAMSGAVFAGAIGVGFTAGSLAGGAVGALGSWRAGFALSVPCCLVAAALAGRLEPSRRVQPSAGWPTALGVGGLVAAGTAGTSLVGLPATAVAATALVAFALGLGARPAAVACGATMILTGTCVAGTLAIALRLQDGRSALATGVVLACFGLATLPAARAAGRGPPAALVAAALAAQGVALIGAATVRADLAVAACVAALGFGHVLGNAATADVAARTAPAQGVIAGTLGSAQRLGGALGPLLLAPTAGGLALGGAVALVAAAVAGFALLHVPRR